MQRLPMSLPPHFSVFQKCLFDWESAENSFILSTLNWMLVIHKIVVTEGFMISYLEIAGTPFLWCNYRNIWLIILEEICDTYG